MLTKEQYDLMTLYLASFYDTPLYKRHGVEHPIVFYPPQPHQVKDIDSVLGYLSHDLITADSMAFYNYAYLHTLQNSNRHLFNGTTFVFKRLREKPLRIDAAFGKYFDMIATCAWLEQEILELAQNGGLRLPMRSQYHRGMDMKMSLTHGKERSAAIGAVMLVVFRDRGEYQAIISRRTSQHATGPNALHLMPAFIFQPMTEPMQTYEWSLKHHVYREWLEELFGMPEGDSAMDSHPALLNLKEMEADGGAEMCLTGIIMNLLTLRPEISLVLVIHDETWWQDLQSGAKGYQLNTPEMEENLLLVPISDDEQLLSVLPQDYFLTMVPQAISALWEGVDMARGLIAGR
jgi:hypothetical protein